MKGLMVDVYRCSLGDCTNHGVTERADKMILVGEGVPEIFEAGPTVLRLVRRFLGGKEAFYAVPENPAEVSAELMRAHSIPGARPTARPHSMFGGNFVWTSDSRFREACGERPLPVHDRFEGQAARRHGDPL